MELGKMLAILKNCLNIIAFLHLKKVVVTQKSIPSHVSKTVNLRNACHIIIYNIEN